MPQRASVRAAAMRPCSQHASAPAPHTAVLPPSRNRCPCHHCVAFITHQDLKEALNMLGSLSPDLVVAVELLWTPQERGDAYSKDELLADYPQLVTL